VLAKNRENPAFTQARRKFSKSSWSGIRLAPPVKTPVWVLNDADTVQRNG
jgi:hypothetical protein